MPTNAACIGGSAITFTYNTLVWDMAMATSCCVMYHLLNNDTELHVVQTIPVQLCIDRELSADAVVGMFYKEPGPAGMKESSSTLHMIQLVTYCAIWHLLQPYFSVIAGVVQLPLQ